MCLIDHYNKIIFIAVPKTGTTSIEAFLRKVLSNNDGVIQNHKDLGLSKHANAKDIKEKIKNYDDYHKITVVRNPYDWYVSWYTYRKRQGALVSTQNISFKKYLNLYGNTTNGIFKKISDRDDNIIVNTIIRYEDDIEKEFIDLLSKLLNKKIDYKFPKKNISEARKQKPYQDFYDEETKDIVTKLQSKTIKYFGYEF